MERRIVLIAGAGYAGLHVAQRLGSWIERDQSAGILLVDQHEYHQLMTELPRVAAGTRLSSRVEVPLKPVLPASVEFKQAEVIGFDLADQVVRTSTGNLRYWRLVLALGSRPNDFQIPGLAERALFMWSTADAVRVKNAVEATVEQAAGAQSDAQRHRLMTVVIGGGGATGVELAGGLAEELPKLAAKHGVNADSSRVVLVEAGRSILAGSSPELVRKARDILRRLHVQVLTNSTIAEAGPEGFRLADGHVVEGGAFIWAGGVKAVEIVAGMGLEVGYNGRVKVDRYLRACDHEGIYVAGDLASVPDSETGMALPPLAQTALAEAETVAENLRRELQGKEVEPFEHRSRGLVVSVGTRRGVAEAGGITIGGGLARALKDAIEWEYRQSVRHLRGWAAG